jgi:hypothetical protein
MPSIDSHLDRTCAVALLKARGFNRLDIECVLDLTEHMSLDGKPVWRMDRLQRVAGRAYWLAKRDIDATAA